MYSKSEAVNGYSQVYGREFGKNPWDADRMLKNVNTIYDDLISGYARNGRPKSPR
jgi:hypothetical protein